LVHDRGGFEAHDHSPRSKRRRLQLQHLLVDQLDASSWGRGVADFDNRDRWVSDGDHALQ
jgi:hypothetical protein